MATTYIKRGDTGPAFAATLRDATGVAVDLTGATSVRFHMRDRVSKAVKVDAAAAVSGAATGGRVSYAWQAADTDTAGEFEVEVEVTLADGTVQTFPSDGWHPVDVVEDIA